MRNLTVQEKYLFQLMITKNSLLENTEINSIQISIKERRNSEKRFLLNTKPTTNRWAEVEVVKADMAMVDHLTHLNLMDPRRNNSNTLNNNNTNSSNINNNNMLNHITVPQNNQIIIKVITDNED